MSTKSMQAMGYIDGVIAPLQDIRVPVLDRGFLYGDSIYEVLRTYAGIPFLFDEHFARLQNSARLSGMRISQSKLELVQALRATVAACDNTAREDVYIRYQITRGQAEGAGAIDLYAEPNLKTRLVIMLKPLPEWKPHHYQVGMEVGISSVHRNAPRSLDPNIKGGNYLNNVLALAEVKRSGLDECLMLDAQGFVTECSNSNIWFVLDDQLVTPQAGNLVGLTRRKLLALFSPPAEAVSERAIHHTDLTRTTECFVTSATREVMPVAKLHTREGHTIAYPPGGGAMTKLAQQRYAAMLAEFVRDNQSSAWF